MRRAASRSRARCWRWGRRACGPRPSPRTTVPSTKNGRPSSSRRPVHVARGPGASRTRLLLIGARRRWQTGTHACTPKPRLRPSAAQARDVARAAAAEAEAVAHHHRARAERLVQDALRELRRGLRGQRRRERQHRQRGRRPGAARRSAFCVEGHEGGGGALRGAARATGCGSKVRTTAVPRAGPRVRHAPPPPGPDARGERRRSCRRSPRAAARRAARSVSRRTSSIRLRPRLLGGSARSIARPGPCLAGVVHRAQEVAVRGEGVVIGPAPRDP